MSGHNIADYFPGMAPYMSLKNAIEFRDRYPDFIICREHNGLVEGMDAIAVLRYGKCLQCACSPLVQQGTTVELDKAREKMDRAAVELDKARMEWDKARAELSKATVEWDSAGAEKEQLP